MAREASLSLTNAKVIKPESFYENVRNKLCLCFYIETSPAGSLLAVKLHSENGVIFKGKYEILISLILQWQDNPRKTLRNQLS